MAQKVKNWSDDPWKGDYPPDNTPYFVIKKYRGGKFLTGWVAADKSVDPDGHRSRRGAYLRFLSEKKSQKEAGLRL